jgi:hypothetical protein
MIVPVVFERNCNGLYIVIGLIVFASLSLN